MSEPLTVYDSSPPRKWTYGLIALAVVVLDQWTKWLVEANLPLHSSYPIVPDLLNFTHVRNTGVAFGMFASHGEALGTMILTVVGLVALGVVAWFFHKTPKTDRLLLWALALILGGAIGNLIDRIVRGAVTDFVDFYVGTYHWHTFNVADSAITVGIVLMAADALRQRASDPSGGTEAVEGAS